MNQFFRLFFRRKGMNVQTRSEENGLREFATIAEAMNHAKEDLSVWKVSFAVGDERVRLTRNAVGEWYYEPII